MEDTTYTFDTGSCLLNLDNVSSEVPKEIKEVSENFESSFKKVSDSMDETIIENPDEKLNEIFS